MNDFLKLLTNNITFDQFFSFLKNLQYFYNIWGYGRPFKAFLASRTFQCIYIILAQSDLGAKYDELLK